MNNYQILVVDDEKEITKAIGIYLRNQGYQVFIAYNGEEGLAVLNDHTIDLAIVDIMMPVMDGTTMVMKLREKLNIPVIMLSAKSEDMDKVTGLNIGADDYITKPFVPLELIARVNSQLRRYARYKMEIDKVKEHSNIFNVGGLELNITNRMLQVEGEEVRLTPIEFKIMHLFMKEPGRVFSAEEIYESVWKEKAITTDTIMVHIRRIREKIELNPKKPQYLKVVWGVGYKFEDK